jgi:hypothetical protein
MRMKQGQTARTNESRAPLIVGGSRNEHGTRICRKVTCVKCLEVDHVPVSRSKKSDQLYCRKCAILEMGAHEKGTRIKSEMAEVKCAQCAKTFEFPTRLIRRGPLFCSDCHKGFEVWRGSKATPVDERNATSISRRPAGTLLRKKVCI